MDCCIIVDAFRTHFCNKHRLTRSELTANIKNIQISAEICKEQTQIKNADTKTLIDHLQFTECTHLQQTPIYKYGGGGARAAWRIRIRRPRLAERGARGVSNTSADFCRLQSLRRTPPYPPTRGPWSTKIAFCRPSDAKCRIFGWLFADRKFIKNRTPQKLSQNLKSRTPDRPKFDFVLTCGINFGMDFRWNSWFLRNMLKPQKPCKGIYDGTSFVRLGSWSMYSIQY